MQGLEDAIRAENGPKFFGPARRPPGLVRSRYHHRCQISEIRSQSLLVSTAKNVAADSVARCAEPKSDDREDDYY
jgi:hypothetical protein